MDFFEFATTALSFLQQYNSGDSFRIFWLALLIGALCFLLVYFFQAFALFTIASREGFKNKWMAFIPFLNTYYVGVVSEKNKIFNLKAKTVSAALAVLELVIVTVYILFFVSAFLMISGDYYIAEYESLTVMGETIERFVGYRPTNGVPTDLAWAAWFFCNSQNYLISWLQLIYILLNVFLLCAFFQTYATRRYFIFTIFSVLFPVKGILFFVVRNNRGKNYREYIRELQQRQYRMYREMNRQNMNENPYNYNPYSGTSTTASGEDPYRENRTQSAPEDPFAEFGRGNADDKSAGDPFDDFKN